MNRITIEPGILKDQWAHVWLTDFQIILTTQHDTPNLSASDIQWLNHEISQSTKASINAAINSNTGRANQSNPIDIAESATEQGFPLRKNWYSSSEIEEAANRRKTERIKHNTESPSCP